MRSIAYLHRSLMEWFLRNQAELPWRHGRDPYRVWVSEIMLQQTQVGTVIPYFEKFVARFPDLRSLAGAPMDDLLKVWEGLGYYARARNMHRAAQKVMAEFGGEFPRDLRQLQSLPGIGKYTAGAIASFAFGASAPVLDGNITRVLTRLLDVTEDITLPETRRHLWKIAEDMLPDKNAAVWNEGLMELGRLVCIPANPECGACPLTRYCVAYKRAVQNDRPVRTQRNRLPHHDVAAGVIRDKKGQILIAQRLPHGLLGGLWEFPGGKREPGESLEACLRREIMEELAVRVRVGQKIAAIRHSYTHFKITLHVFECRFLSGKPVPIGCAQFIWTSVDRLDSYAFPRTNRRVIHMLQQAG